VGNRQAIPVPCVTGSRRFTARLRNCGTYRDDGRGKRDFSGTLDFVKRAAGLSDPVAG